VDCQVTTVLFVVLSAQQQGRPRRDADSDPACFCALPIRPSGLVRWNSGDSLPSLEDLQQLAGFAESRAMPRKVLWIARRHVQRMFGDPCDPALGRLAA